MIHIDFETRSFAELSGKTGVGTRRYAEDPTTTILCMAYRFDHAPPRIWAPWRGRLDQLRTEIAPSIYPNNFSHLQRCQERPNELLARIARGEKIVAHHAFFERNIWEEILVSRYGWPSIPDDQWVCSMATAQAYGLPAGLDLAVKTLGLTVAKGSQKAMKRMMKPRSAWTKNQKGDIWFATEQDYAELCEYCMQDVIVESALYDACKKMTPREIEIWRLDQRINLRGVGIDRRLAEGAWSVFDQKRTAAPAALSALTGGAVDAPTQTAKIPAWVTGRGVSMTDCQAGTIERLLDSDLPGDVRRVLEIRQSVGGAAAGKFESFLRHASPDDRVRGELIYHGAHTGRWTSKGVQLHNAVKNKMNVDEAEKYIPCFYESTPGNILGALAESGLPADRIDALIATLVRSVIVADPGCIFVDLDYSSIEARVVAWLAGETELIAAFFENTPVYEQMAAEIFGIHISQVTKEQRALGKVAILGLGYGMGADKFYQTCIDWGVSIVTPELAERAKTLYRKKYSKIVQYWYDFEAAIKKAIMTGTTQRFKTATITYSKQNKILAYTLPNGRWLHYHHCTIKDGSVEYFGKLPPPSSGYGRVYSWGGKFTENQDQALSRDYMAHAMIQLDKLDGCEVLLTVHDELLNQVRFDRLNELLPEIIRRTTEPVLWATGLPIGCGHWVGTRFRKD